MEYFSYNLKAIEARSEIYDKLKPYLYDRKQYEEVTGRFKIIETRDKEKTVGIHMDDGRTLKLNSIYNAKREADTWGNKYAEIQKVTSIIMYGCGNGLFYKEIEKKTNAFSIIFLYEPDLALFLFCIKEFDISDILSDKRVKLYINGINDKDFYRDISENINWAMLSSQVLCNHPMYDRLYEKNHMNFMKKIEEYRYSLELSKNASLHLAKLFTKQLLKNLQFIKGSNYITELIDRIDTNIPIIIVSAGPSLEKNISDLKLAEKKAFILATDTAVRYLIKNNINFDAIVTVDGTKPKDFLDDIRCREKCMFVKPDANYDILKENTGRKIWINGCGYLETLYSEYGFVFPKYIIGGSVATAAFWIAEVLGAKKIILVGQDLSYDGKNTHADNIIDIKKRDYNKDIVVEGVNGEKVKTRWDWFRYLKWFENEIIRLDDSIEVIDATEGGAKIHGTNIMTLSQTIKLYCTNEFDFDTILKEIKPTFDEKLYQLIYNKILSIENNLKKIFNISKEAYSAADRGIKNLNFDEEKINTIFEIIDDSKKCIAENEIYVLLDEYISEDVADKLTDLGKENEDERQRMISYLDNCKVLFGALMAAANDLQPIVNDLVDKL